MKYAGVVTDPSWLLPFTREINGRINHMKMCEHCGQEYVTYHVINDGGPAQNMAFIAPSHEYCCKKNQIEQDIYKSFLIPKEFINENHRPTSREH